MLNIGIGKPFSNQLYGEKNFLIASWFMDSINI